MQEKQFPVSIVIVLLARIGDAYYESNLGSAQRKKSQQQRS